MISPVRVEVDRGKKAFTRYFDQIDFNIKIILAKLNEQKLLGQRYESNGFKITINPKTNDEL